MRKGNNLKRTALLISMLLMVVAFFLTGCGGNKQAGTGLPQDVVTKISSMTEDNKTSDPTGTSEQSPDNQNQAVSSSQVENSPTAEVPKNVDTTKPVESKSTESKPTESKPAESTPVGNTSMTTQSTGTTNQDTGTTSVAAVSPPVPASVPVPATAQNTVTMSINCQTAVDKGMHKQDKFKDTVPENGIILAPITVELKDGENAFDILKSVVRDKKLHMEYEGSKGTPYIRGINNLYEFDGGPLSGWMFCVNKVYPNYGCGQYKLKAGDVIEWNYTCNLGKDLGQEWIE